MILAILQPLGPQQFRHFGCAHGPARSTADTCQTAGRVAVAICQNGKLSWPEWCVAGARAVYEETASTIQRIGGWLCSPTAVSHTPTAE
jgi:hypothetical protein